MNLRVAHLLCEQHRALAYWPTLGGLDGLRAICEDCAALIAALPAEGVFVRFLPDALGVDREGWNAVHEAAHVVAGLAAGFTLDRVEINADGGEVFWHDPTVAEGAALPALVNIWAGQVASLRWIAERGIDTVENRIDVVLGAGHDADEARRFCVWAGLPYGAGLPEAEAFVDASWGDIVRLASHLLASKVMNAEQVSAQLKSVTT